MSQETDLLYAGNPSNQPLEPLSWLQTWILVLTRPSIGTFERIIRDPKASAARAYRWIFISVFIGATLRDVISMLLSIINGSTDIGATFFPIAGNVLVAAFLVLDIAFTTWVIQGFVGKFFHGSGTYSSLVYTFAAFGAPIYLIHSLIIGIPFAQCIAVPLFIYGMALYIIAVKTVNRIRWGQAVASFLGVYVLMFGIVFVMTLCILALLGPAISDVFQNIIQNPGSTVP